MGNKIGQYPDAQKKIVDYSGAPVIDGNGNVYFSSPEPISVDEKWGEPVVKAFKFTPRLAELVWETVMGNEIMDNEGGNVNGGGGQPAMGIESPPALGIDGRSLYGAVGCTISKLDTSSGKLLWSLKPDGASGHFNASPAIDNEDNLYIGTKSNNESRFYAISADGQQLWRTDIGSDLYNSPILTNDNSIYVGSETNPKGKFHVLDRITGVIKSSYFTDNERKVPDFTHDGMLLYKGYVYVGVHSADEGNPNGEFSPTFFKIRVDTNDYLPDAAWPRIYGNNQNTNRIDFNPSLVIEDLSVTPTLANSMPTPTLINRVPTIAPTQFLPTNTPSPTSMPTPTPTVYQLQYKTVTTPYVNEEDVSSVNEAFSLDANNPYWGFWHPGVDFMITKSSIPVQAATSGTVENLTIEKSEGIMGWHAGFCINHGINSVCYNLESFGSTDEIGSQVAANLFIQNGSVVNQGDVIANLIYGGSGAHIDFGITYPGTRICPEPYFTDAARESVMRLIHKSQPTWPMCY